MWICINKEKNVRQHFEIVKKKTFVWYEKLRRCMDQSLINKPDMA